jgi:cytochrome c2
MTSYLQANSVTVRIRQIVIAFAGAAALAPPAIAQDIEAGRLVARRYCSGCHEIRKNPAYSEMAPSFEDIAHRPGTSSTSLNMFLSTPHNRMPGYLMRQEIYDVSAYIVSLKAK